MNSEGFAAFLKTTDERLPLGNYMTVLMGTATYFATLEEENKKIREYFAVAMGMTQNEADIYIDAHLNDVDLHPDPEKESDSG